MMNDIRTEDEHIAGVKSLLGTKLPKDIDKLKEVLRNIEWRHIGIMSARIEAQANLQTKRLRYLHPKDKEMTDMDRKIQLDANTSEEQAKYEKLASIEKALEQRITVIKALLD